MRLLARLVLLLLVIAGLVQLSRYVTIPPCADIKSFVDRQGVLAPLAFFFMYLLATTAFVPGTLVTMLAGLSFGVVQGVLLIIVSATTGVVLAFYISRYFCRGLVERYLQKKPWFAAFQANIERKGFAYVLFLRLVPVVPFNILNYACGVAPLKVRDYALASFLGMLPGTIAYVYLGKAGCLLIDPILNGEFAWSGIPAEAKWSFVVANVVLIALVATPIFFKRYLKS